MFDRRFILQSLTSAEDCLFTPRKGQLQIWDETFWERKPFITPCFEEGAHYRVGVATREGYIIAKERGEFMGCILRVIKTWTNIL